MKEKIIYAALLSLVLASCSKPDDQLLVEKQNSAIDRGGSGSSGGGGSNNNSSSLQSVLSGTAFRLVSGTTDSIFIVTTQPAPASGWTITLTSSNPQAVQVPATVMIPAGQRVIQPHVIAGQVSTATNVTITVRLNGEIKTTVLKVFPLTATFPAPQLQSPGNNSSFKPREIITFTWNANNNAFYYQFQIANNTGFVNPETNVLLNDPIWRQSAFSAFNNFWRVRFVAADGSAGPWSAVRSFSIR